MCSMSNGECSPQQAPCPYEIKKDEVLLRGRWLSYREVTFVKADSQKEHVCQSVFRPMRPADAPADGAVIVALLRRNAGAQKLFVLVKQWRIAINGWSLEFPAGQRID